VPSDNLEPVDAKRQAVRWCRASLWQAHRLRQAFEPPGPSAGVRPGFFDRIAAKQHFLLIALSQIGRALAAMGEEDDFPRELRLLRNVREHWDEWHLPKGSAARLREDRPDQGRTRTEAKLKAARAQEGRGRRDHCSQQLNHGPAGGRGLADLRPLAAQPYHGGEVPGDGNKAHLSSTRCPETPRSLRHRGRPVAIATRRDLEHPDAAGATGHSQPGG
jgi:hypothetical protein